MRFICNLDGLAQNWAEIDEQWTRTEYIEMLNAVGLAEQAGDDGAFIAILRRKLLTCHIEWEDQTTITQGDELTEAVLDAMPYELFSWLANLLPTVTDLQRIKGNSSVIKAERGHNRYESGLPELAGNWAIVSAKWSREEAERVRRNDGLLALLQQKVEGCRLLLADGSVLQSMAELNEELLDRCGLYLFGWLGGLLPFVVEQRRQLGNASARPSSSNAATPTMSAPN